MRRVYPSQILIVSALSTQGTKIIIIQSCILVSSPLIWSDMDYSKLPTESEDLEEDLLEQEVPYSRDATVFIFRPACIAVLAMVMLSSLVLYIRTDILESLELPFYKKDTDFLHLLEMRIVKKYVSWHKQTLRNIDKGRINISDVKLIIWRGSHGLGDRFRGLLNVFITAVISERLLLCDWGDSIPISHVFNLGVGTKFTYDERYLGKVRYISGPRNRHSPIHNLDLFLSNESVIVSSANSKPFTSDVMEVHSKYPDLRYSKVVTMFLDKNDNTTVTLEEPDLFHMLLKYLIGRTSEMNRFIESIKSSGLVKYGGDEHESQKLKELPDEYVSIHIRYGKGVGENSGNRFNFTSKGLNKRLVARCIARNAKEMKNRLNMTKGKYFLATDSPEIRNTFGEQLLQLDGKAELFFGNWSVDHISTLRKHNEENIKALQVTYAEIMLLSQGKGMVHLYSGFANLAKWIGDIRSAILVTPKHDCMDLVASRSRGDTPVPRLDKSVN